MNANMINILLLIGRILYGGFFLMSGLNHFTKMSMYKQFTASKGIPAPALAVGGSGLLILLGGLSVLLGFQPHIGLLLIAIFLVGVTPGMHAFWNGSDGRPSELYEKRGVTRRGPRHGGDSPAVVHEYRALNRVSRHRNDNDAELRVTAFHASVGLSY